MVQRRAQCQYIVVFQAGPGAAGAGAAGDDLVFQIDQAAAIGAQPRKAGHSLPQTLQVAMAAHAANNGLSVLFARYGESGSVATAELDWYWIGGGSALAVALTWAFHRSTRPLTTSSS